MSHQQGSVRVHVVLFGESVPATTQAAPPVPPAQLPQQQQSQHNDANQQQTPHNTKPLRSARTLAKQLAAASVSHSSKFSTCGLNVCGARAHVIGPVSKTMMMGVQQVCAYACVHTYIHTNIHTYKHTYKHTYIHSYIHTYIHTYMYTYIHTYIQTCMNTYIHRCMHT